MSVNASVNTSVRLQRMVLVALMTAAVCVMAPWSLPVGPIPITLASLGVYLAAGLLGARRGTLSVTLYVLLGALGVPVFSGFSGGFHRLVGVTGGYIVGYIVCAFLAGLMIDRLHFRLRTPVALLCGTAALYLLGTVWYILSTGNPVASALAACVLPFLPGDAVKIIVASAVISPLRAALSRHGLV